MAAALLAGGTEPGLTRALGILKDSATKRRLEGLLRRESGELQVILRRALSLDEGGAEDLGEQDLGARYTELLAASASPELRARAARGLKALGLAPISLLTRAVRSDPDPAVRSACVEALAAATPYSDDAIRGFLDALNDPIGAVRTEAAKALGAVMPLTTPAYDNAPGGKRNSLVQFGQKIDRSIGALIQNNTSLNWSINSYVKSVNENYHCFIPTISGLDINTTDLLIMLIPTCLIKRGHILHSFRLTHIMLLQETMNFTLK